MNVTLSVFAKPVGGVCGHVRKKDPQGKTAERFVFFDTESCAGRESSLMPDLFLGFCRYVGSRVEFAKAEVRVRLRHDRLFTAPAAFHTRSIGSSKIWIFPEGKCKDIL